MSTSNTEIATKYISHADPAAKLSFEAPNTTNGECSVGSSIEYKVYADADADASGEINTWITVLGLELTINGPTSTLFANAAAKTTVSVYVKATLTTSDGAEIESVTELIIIACTITTSTAPLVHDIQYVLDLVDNTDTLTTSKLNIPLWTQTDASSATCGFAETLTILSTTS